MEFLDARRLTGPNLLWEKPGSILDIACSGGEADQLIPFCEAQIRKMLAAVGWGGESVRHVRLTGGISVAFSAPIDALYAASAINEWVWACCDAEFNGAAEADLDKAAQTIRQAIAEEVNPPLLALEGAARHHDVAFLWDDDEVSVGHGAASETWPFRELPEPSALDWAAYHDVPVGIVTGTNGKTTTARIAKNILQSAGRNVGLSCTDYVAVNDRIIDRDDWSGPGGARMVLRQQDVDAAILETARGGLLRRGLGISSSDAAVITNISEDHLGDFGSRNLDELLNIKWIVSHAVRGSGLLILNADDELLVAKAKDYDGRIAWFSLDPLNAVVARQAANGELAYVCDNGELLRIAGEDREVICNASEIAITLHGAAQHNVANALAAAALTQGLGMTLDQVRDGLRAIGQDANPGRSNLYDYKGFKVLVDFAHNPQAMQALFGMARAIPAKRRALCFAQAGDRTDAQIRELARSAWSIGLDLACISELEKYRRGRDEKEVYTIIRDELLNCGASEEQIRYFLTESESFDAALEWAGPGDLVVILDLGRNSDVQTKLDRG
ncbi:MAG: Mur ligase family protein [Woeseiaceae bacterium]|nr:Mur ligase family protein [Woeseiaceae bacterium]